MRASFVRRRARYLLLAAVLCYVPANAGGLLRWRTPNGSLYVGESPPAGSTFVDRAPRPSGSADGPEAGGETETAAPDAHADPAPTPVSAVRDSAPKELDRDEIDRINRQLQGPSNGGNQLPRIPVVPVPGQR